MHAEACSSALFSIFIYLFIFLFYSIFTALDKDIAVGKD